MNSASIGFSVLQDGFTAIDVAVQQGHEKVVAALLHNDSRVNNSLVTFSFKAIPQASSCWIPSFLYEFFYISV